MIGIFSEKSRALRLTTGVPINNLRVVPSAEYERSAVTNS